MRQKIAIVYEWFDKWGGVERILLTLHEMFPDAHFYTSYFKPQTAAWAKDFNITTSFIDKLPRIIKESRVASLPLYPYAFESFDLSDYDIVISVSSSFAKGVITKPHTLHVAYILTPTRYLWSHKQDYGSSWARAVASPFIGHLEQWDRIASTRPDEMLSISETIDARCRQYYGRSTKVIYPPFDQSYWSSLPQYPHSPESDDYYLIVSRLEPYKKIDIALEAFATLPEEKLVVIGAGTQVNSLKKSASHNVTFLSHVSDEMLASYYKHAKAIIMPQIEDFGYVSLEAQYFGCPVISYRKGGGY